MSIITQEKLENKNQYGVIIANNVKAKITDIELSDINEGILSITLNIIDERYKGKILKDKVSYHRNHRLTWKYLSIRESAGVPYSIDEPSRIDIDELLLNKVVTMNLSSWQNYTRSGQVYDCQKINYVNAPTRLIIPNVLDDYDFDYSYEDDYDDKVVEPSDEVF